MSDDAAGEYGASEHLLAVRGFDNGGSRVPIDERRLAPA
jgi:hypothetical protein